jgi:NAD(P)-dependent dehydrogenase (short-subunit alcohol dehydrogenase family)
MDLGRDFEGRTALVTGAGAGIGRAIAIRLAAAGAKVACADLDEAGALETVELFAGAGAGRASGGGCALAGDVSDPADVQRMMGATVSALGGLDILVNNAGVLFLKRFEDSTLEEWDQTFAVNLRAMFLTCQAALPHLRRSPAGAIVNIASMAALRYTVPHVNYAASKGGVVSFTRDLAFELGADGIRVNAVAPGPIRTSMLAQLSDEQIENSGMRFVLGRIGRVEDVAEAVAFLASDRAAYVTGATLPVTGGAELATRPLRPEDA